MKIWFSFLLLLFTIPGFTQSIVFRTKQFNLDDGVAIKGYDPVSYFTLNKAVKGKKGYSISYLGVNYHFSTSADRDAFQTNPSKYEPQYGGWCAYAMGKEGSKVEVDPETFKIINGRLFLFYNRFFNNTLKSWNLDEPSLHTQADANWQKLLKQ
ncbi:MAG TPA: YHS domain-containing (seleno)protein [Puia sp.]|jgi:YHS domain-containing protein|nr:YHS domain-containing (seleno)protein [Puia sp.]